MIKFSDGQGKAIAAGITSLSLALVFAFVALIAWGVLKFLAFASPALVPVLMGFFLALFFRPYYRWLQRFVHNPTLTLVLMLLSVLVPVGLLLWYAGAVLVDQASSLISQGPELARQVTVWFRQTFPNVHDLLVRFGIASIAPDEIVTKYGSTALKAGTTALKAGTGALSCLTGLVTILLSAIFFVFFLMTKARRGSEIVEQMPFLKDETRNFWCEQIDVFSDILVSFFQRQAIICLIEGVLYGTGFALVGLPYGFLIGMTLGILNLIPLFGSVVCLPIALPVAYFAHGGSLTRLVLVLCVWGAGQLLDGYCITPKIQGNKTGLGYAGVIFSFVFWATILGPMLGMLLAIPLSAFCVVLWRAVKGRYIRPVV